MILLDTDVAHRGSIGSAMETTIRVRVESSTKRALEKLAKEDRRTLSNYLRLVMENTIKNRKSGDLQSAG